MQFLFPTLVGEKKKYTSKPQIFFLTAYMYGRILFVNGLRFLILVSSKIWKYIFVSRIGSSEFSLYYYYARTFWNSRVKRG